MIAEQYQRAKDLLSKHAEGHGKLSDILLEKEMIYAENLEEIFGKRKWVSRAHEIMQQNGQSASKNAYENSEPQKGETKSKGAESSETTPSSKSESQ